MQLQPLIYIHVWLECPFPLLQWIPLRQCYLLLSNKIKINVFFYLNKYAKSYLTRWKPEVGQYKIVCRCIKSTDINCRYKYCYIVFTCTDFHFIFAFCIKDRYSVSAISYTTPWKQQKPQHRLKFLLKKWVLIIFNNVIWMLILFLNFDCGNLVLYWY